MCVCACFCLFVGVFQGVVCLWGFFVILRDKIFICSDNEYDLK